MSSILLRVQVSRLHQSHRDERSPVLRSRTGWAPCHPGTPSVYRSQAQGCQAGRPRRETCLSRHCLPQAALGLARNSLGAPCDQLAGPSVSEQGAHAAAPPRARGVCGAGRHWEGSLQSSLGDALTDVRFRSPATSPAEAVSDRDAACLRPRSLPAAQRTAGAPRRGANPSTPTGPVTRQAAQAPARHLFTRLSLSNPTWCTKGQSPKPG